MNITDIHINDYTEHIQYHINHINTIILENANDSAGSLYKKTLLISLLDNMAKVAFPTETNKRRMINFLQTFSDWKDGNKISLPALRKLTERTGDSSYDRARNFAQEELNKWQSGSLVQISQDADLQTVAAIWPVHSSEKINKTLPASKLDVSLEDLQHYNMFYQYRNCVIHESRVPGVGDYHVDSETPYYSSSFVSDPRFRSGRTIRGLVYPLKFFTYLCQTSLTNLKKDLTQNQIDPLTLFSFGEFFIESLN